MNTINQQSYDPQADRQAQRNDRTFLRLSHATEAAIRAARSIARKMNCRFSKVLDEELFDIVDNADTSGIPQKELDSFKWAQVIIQATHRDTGETHYIAVAAAYKAIRQDASLAIRNAEFISRFTGQLAHAVVAAQRVRPDIEPLIESGEVRWAQILQKELETE